MDFSLAQIGLICGACFLAGIMNASGGSGGIISVPGFLLAGLDPHRSVATNKVQAVMGLGLAVVRYAREGLINPKLAVFCAVFGSTGAVVGSQLSLLASETFLMYAMFAILPFCAWAVLWGSNIAHGRPEEVTFTPNLAFRVSMVALVCGVYDGFYGPGSGTFIVIGLELFTNLGVKTVAAHAKVINLCDNLAALIVFFIHGKALLWLGLIAGACNMLGAWIGAGAIIKKGDAIMKPLLLLALVLLVISLITKL